MFSIYFRKHHDENRKLFTLIIKMYILFAHAIITLTARPSSVFLSSNKNTIFNQSAHIFSLSCFLVNSSYAYSIILLPIEQVACLPKWFVSSLQHHFNTFLMGSVFSTNHNVRSVRGTITTTTCFRMKPHRVGKISTPAIHVGVVAQ